jgi:hypothetical protein
MSVPHYNNGRLLLKDQNSNNWYYVSITLLDGQPYINPGQDAVTVPATPTFAENVVIRAADGNYYRLSLYSSEGVIFTAEEELATPEPPYRVFLRTDGVFYELVILPDELGNNYLSVIPASAGSVTTRCSPFKLTTLSTTEEPRGIVSAEADCVREIIVAAS